MRAATTLRAAGQAVDNRIDVMVNATQRRTDPPAERRKKPDLRRKIG